MFKNLSTKPFQTRITKKFQQVVYRNYISKDAIDECIIIASNKTMEEMKIELAVEKERGKLIAELAAEKEKGKFIAELAAEKGKTELAAEKGKTELAMAKGQFMLDLGMEQHNTKLLKAKILADMHSHSIRSVIGNYSLTIETIFSLNQPKIKGIQQKINKELENSGKYQAKIYHWCKKFNTNYDQKIAANIYHSISTHSHAGRYPIECHTNDNILSQAEWAFVIAVFDINLPTDAFVVYDSNDNPI
jgi:hypothetical protein